MIKATAPRARTLADQIPSIQSKRFHVSYQIINRGPTQEALDGTFNAVVRITGMRPFSPDGPGIEFLNYRTLPTRRPAPVGSENNDLVHVHLTLRVDNLDGQVHELEDNRVRFISPGIVALSSSLRAAMVRDPDGHVLLLEDSDDVQ